MSQKEKPSVNVDALISLVLADAASKRDNAAYSGSYDDGGASQLEAQVRFYNYGRKGQVPPEWKSFESKLDPEYEEYQRLQKKFEQR